MGARIAEEELLRIKKEVDLAALVRSKGIELKSHGKNLIGLSPFREEKNPSFIVTPGKNLWHDMGSGKGGSVIDFVMHYEGVSFRHACELLAGGEVNRLFTGGKARRQSTVRKLECPLDLQAGEAELMEQVLAYYHQRLLGNVKALEYLEKRGIGKEAVETFGIGYADRSLGLRLPEKNRKEGALLREKLQTLGIYRESGHEHFNGCVTFPIRDEAGKVGEIYGRKIQRGQKTGIDHLYLPGAHRGLFNRQAFGDPSGVIILCESVIDALSFWCAGYKNVTCIWGSEGFNQDHLEAFKKHHTQQVYLAYDRDEAGERAAGREAETLQAIGIECHRVLFPHGMDANQYALNVRPASKSLGMMLQSAQWLGKGTKPPLDHPSIPLAAKAANVSRGEAVAKTELAAKKKEAVEANARGEILLELGDRNYRVRGLEKNQTLDTLKINLRLMVMPAVEGPSSQSEALFHIDALDLYQQRQRHAFIETASLETSLDKELLKRDLGKLLLELERCQEQRLSQEAASQQPAFEMNSEEHAEAMALLKSPGLLQKSSPTSTPAGSWASKPTSSPATWRRSRANWKNPWPSSCKAPARRARPL